MASFPLSLPPRSNALRILVISPLSFRSDLPACNLAPSSFTVLVVKDTLLLFISTGNGNRRLSRRIFWNTTLPLTSHLRRMLLSLFVRFAESPDAVNLRAEGLFRKLSPRADNPAEARWLRTDL